MDYKLLIYKDVNGKTKGKKFYFSTYGEETVGCRGTCQVREYYGE